MSFDERASQGMVLTAMQREVLVEVSRGHATAAQVEAALAFRGLVHSRRGVQRILRRMCLRGFLKAAAFLNSNGSRCHFHIVLPEGRAAYAERERLLPAAADAPQLASEAECPPPEWALRAPPATRPTRVTPERIARFLGQHLPQLLPYLPLALSPPRVCHCFAEAVQEPPQLAAPGEPWSLGSLTGLSSQWMVLPW